VISEKYAFFVSWWACSSANEVHLEGRHAVPSEERVVPAGLTRDTRADRELVMGCAPEGASRTVAAAEGVFFEERLAGHGASPSTGKRLDVSRRQGRISMEDQRQIAPEHRLPAALHPGQYLAPEGRAPGNEWREGVPRTALAGEKCQGSF
jgi:hypothetical protein